MNTMQAIAETSHNPPKDIAILLYVLNILWCVAFAVIFAHENSKG